MGVRVGADVEAVCRRCGDVWHVVVALDEGRIARVECGECGARHRYRAAGGRSGPPPATRTRPSSRTRSARGARPVVEADPARPRRPFSTRETYQVGDRIVHASFGEGVVQAVTGPRKVEVLFEGGPRILVHGRR